MKATFVLLSLLLSSCSSVDVLVEKSQIKAETETHYLVPSSALTPVVNADELNGKLSEIIVNATK
jgi:archaellum component FlaF (FlaF/FlaG flagellin family)